MAFLPFLLPFPVTPNPTGLPIFLSYWGLTCSCKKYLVNFTQFPQHRWLFSLSYVSLQLWGSAQSLNY